MTTRGDIDTIVKNVLTTQLLEMEKAVERDVLAVYGPIVHGLDRLVNDAVEAIGNRKPKLLLVLHTLGGLAEVTERIVDSMRHRYQDIAVAIPDVAMSAGTILAMACDSILMDHFSRLGPIDPQVLRNGRPVPTRGYLIQYDRLRKLDQEGKLTSPDAMLLNKLDLAELHDFEQAEQLSITLLRKWLVTYKFKDWTQTNTRKEPVTPEMRQARAEQIAVQLNDNTRWHSHGRGISRETLECELNLRIDRLEQNADLAKAMRSYHDCLVDYMQMTSLHVFAHSRDHY